MSPDAMRIDVRPRGQGADRLHGVRHHQAAETCRHARGCGDELVVLAREVLVLTVAFAFTDGVIGKDDGTCACVEDARVEGVPA